MKNPKSLYEKDKTNLANIISKLELINPLKVLGRGYSVTYKDDKIISSVKDLKVNDKLRIKLSDGEVVSKIEEV